MLLLKVPRDPAAQYPTLNLIILLQNFLGAFLLYEL